MSILPIVDISGLPDVPWTTKAEHDIYGHRWEDGLRVIVLPDAKSSFILLTDDYRVGHHHSAFHRLRMKISLDHSDDSKFLFFKTKQMS